MTKLSVACLTLAVSFSLCPRLTLAQSNQDAVLMTVGDSKVTVAEFDNVYKKNSGKESVAEKKSLNDYVDLYINFKLKVKEAEELKLDTSEAFKKELAGYRQQLAQPYLTDKNVSEQLLKEAYERKQLEVRSSHILVKCAENALPKDTLIAYNKIMGYRDMLMGKKGPKIEFETLAKSSSEDPSAKENGGDLGYFSAFDLVYPFETAVYTAKIGEISMPVRTKFGYHLIKVIDRRPAQGEIQVAHIMIKTPKGMTREDSVKTRATADQILEKIKSGANFADLAKQFSDDKGSAPKGGELPWFGINRMPVEFEKASFALKNNGDVSEVVRTRYGWHIIKRLDRRNVGSFEDMKSELKAKVAKDSRSQMGRTSMIAKIKAEYKFKDNPKLETEFYAVVDSDFFKGNWKVAKAEKLNKVMFALNDQKYTQVDFAKFIGLHQSKRAKTELKPVLDALYKQFVDESCIAYEEAHLDQKYPEFRSLMREYRDGILLFDLTDKKVWSKAVKDTVGLREYYEKNKQNYLWEERAEASIYTCADERIANEVKAMLKKKKTEKEILDQVNKNSQLNLQIESKDFLPKENSFVDANWNPGISATKTENGKVMFVEVTKLLKPQPKEFNESKGLVTADYQNYLEKEWINSLKTKYPVTVNKDVLATIQ